MIANNIANSNTTAFKRSQAQFSDLIYQAERAAGVPDQGNSTSAAIPESSQVGLGVQLSAIVSLNISRPDHQNGQYARFGDQRPWLVSGFGHEQPNAVHAGGSFSQNAQGQLVTQDGYLVLPNITFPTGTVDIQINTTGAVFVDKGDGKGLSPMEQIKIAGFVNDAGLQALGNNSTRRPRPPGTRSRANPGDVGGYGTLQEGYLEGSNVDPVQEITNLISAQRNYEMNSKIITAADEMYQVITKNTL